MVYQQAMPINGAVFGPESWQVAANLTQLGNVNRFQKQFSEAETCYRRALEIDEKVLGPDHLRVAGNLNDLAVSLQSD